MAYRSNNPFRDEGADDFEEIRTSELSRINAEKNRHRSAMLDSSERSKRVLADTENIAVETQLDLSRQGESLNRTEKNLDKMLGDMKKADRDVTSMKSIWGTIGNYFRKAPTTNLPPNPAPDSESSTKTTHSDIHPNRYTDGESTERSRGAQRQAKTLEDEYEFALNRNLDDISVGLSSLKQHALAMGDTIERHNDQIDRITTKTDKVDKNIEDTNKRIRKILN